MLGHVYGLEGTFLQRPLVQRWCETIDSPSQKKVEKY